jgi:hypothetical protein
MDPDYFINTPASGFTEKYLHYYVENLEEHIPITMNYSQEVNSPPSSLKYYVKLGEGPQLLQN